MTVGDVLRGVAGEPDVNGRIAALPSAVLAAVCRGVAYDSRRVQPGFVFVALQGRKVDGVAFVAAAVTAGAVLVVAGPATVRADHVPWLIVPDARRALALLAAEYHGHPSRRLRVVGITGTNGKTTTSFLLHSIFETSGTRCGLIGTVSYRAGDRVTPAARTTPEAPDLQGLMAEMVAAGCGACVAEVSSHALALRRVDGVQFAAGVFTNLTRDHLDFHVSMEEYFAAKRRLFELLPSSAPAVINVDDPRGATLVESAGHPVSYGMSRPADVTPGPLSYSLQGLEFEARTPGGPVQVKSRLIGRPNVYNILAAVTTAVALGVPIGAVEAGVRGLTAVPGRFEVVSSSQDDITVVVDYAHTDDALRNLLETARPLASGRVITVFGAGGERDRTKRPLMGMIAARLSDVVVITSDNPRSEDPARIIDEVRQGADSEAHQGGAQVTTVLDRREAIARAVRDAAPHDVVLLAGKGHETYQEIRGETLPFDDAAVAREALRARRLRARVG